MIHPGTRFLRIGRASDVFPVAVPHVIARKSKMPVPPPVHVSSIVGNTKKKRIHSSGEENAMDVDPAQESWDPVSSVSLRFPLTHSLFRSIQGHHPLPLL